MGALAGGERGWLPAQTQFIRTDGCTHIRVHRPKGTRGHTYTDGQMSTDLCTRMCTHKKAPSIHMQRCIGTHTHTKVSIYQYTHPHVHTQSHLCTHIHAQMERRTHSCPRQTPG